MKMSEVIDKVSELYRSEQCDHRKLRDEYNEVTKEIWEADRTRGKNITYDRYKYLDARRQYLQNEINKHAKYCDGVSAVRELLMDLGFDTEVT